MQLAHHPSLTDLHLQRSLPSLISTSSASSMTSNPSTSSTPMITSNMLKKNRSLSALHYKLPTKCSNIGCFVSTTTFSAPISPKYDKESNDYHKLPSIHKRHIKRHSDKPKQENLSSLNLNSNVCDEEIATNELPSYASDHKTKTSKKTFRSLRKTKHKNSMKRYQSMPALHLDLSTLSIDENSNILHSHHNHDHTKHNKLKKIKKIKIPKSAHISNLSLNAEGIKNNILLQFDLAPKSIDNRSLYEITKSGAFKLNEFVLSSHGLEIEGNNTKYTVTSSDFVEVSILGRGSSSVVYKTWDLKKKTFIALKCISVFEQPKRKQILNELKLLTDNDCANIVHFYGAYFYSGQIVFCLECFDIGSLQELIEINGAIPLKFISYIMKYTLDAVDYLHSKKNIIYRDIKPSNILIHSNGTVKLSDFGIFHECLDDVVCNEVIGTTIYMSPERLNGKQYSYLSDIWSIGLCVAQFIYPNFPLFTNYAESTMLIQQYILNTTKSMYEFFPNGIGISDEATSFMSKCLLKDEALRWSAKQLLKHPFITKYSNIESNDFKSYLSMSNMNKIKKDKDKHELLSMKTSLSELFLKHKITRCDMEIPIEQMQTMLESA